MTLRAAVLGTGSWARKIHLPALAAHPQVDLVGVWGRRGDTAWAVGDEFAIPAYDDLERLLATVDLVSVAVTPQAQPALAAAAARAGVHLVLEKPAAEDALGCEALAAAVASTGVQSTVFLSRLWDPARREWLDAVSAHRWRAIRYGWMSAGMRPGSPGAGDWRREAGPLIDVGPHIIGLAEYLAGPVATIRAEAPAHGRLDLRLTHADGCETVAVVDLLADVTCTNEDITLSGDGRVRGYRNPEAVDFVAAYTGMLDDLLGRVRGTRATSSRGAACSLESAVTMAAVIDEARSQLRGDRGTGGVATPTPART
ncbi:MAG: hypothetical protein BGO37_01660 [Cellulomonas sp. 73-92]|uniref:Gfo/Idh/MocA family protein n=1 Tax=Cellulomonas sp. 73-92 TaxID=1895740 RepID=UPI00092923C9|nr:Gfo/Idh/MocA family oxidoreductase [Cellulomonas sp. 73-92]OJV84218.1 MAG: hypothetical protein BGO37_01660 [Cellulomonas sp. 73-92]